MCDCVLLLCTQTQIASHYCGPKQAKRLKVPDAGDAKIRTSELATKESTLQSPSPSRFSDGATSEGVSLMPLLHVYPGGNKG